MHYSDAIDSFKFTIPFKDINKEFKCSTCDNCGLYENENVLPSKRYFCELTDEFITDIEQELCTKYEQ